MKELYNFTQKIVYGNLLLVELQKDRLYLEAEINYYHFKLVNTRVLLDNS